MGRQSNEYASEDWQEFRGNVGVISKKSRTKMSGTDVSLSYANFRPVILSTLFLAERHREHPAETIPACSNLSQIRHENYQAVLELVDTRFVRRFAPPRS
jgi:hypothetical protein